MGKVSHIILPAVLLMCLVGCRSGHDFVAGDSTIKYTGSATDLSAAINTRGYFQRDTSECSRFYLFDDGTYVAPGYNGLAVIRGDTLIVESYNRQWTQWNMQSKKFVISSPDSLRLVSYVIPKKQGNDTLSLAGEVSYHFVPSSHMELPSANLPAEKWLWENDNKRKDWLERQDKRLKNDYDDPFRIADSIAVDSPMDAEAKFDRAEGVKRFYRTHLRDLSNEDERRKFTLSVGATMLFGNRDSITYVAGVSYHHALTSWLGAGGSAGVVHYGFNREDGSKYRRTMPYIAPSLLLWSNRCLSGTWGYISPSAEIGAVLHIPFTALATVNGFNTQGCFPYRTRPVSFMVKAGFVIFIPYTVPINISYTLSNLDTYRSYNHESGKFSRRLQHGLTFSIRLDL